LLDYTQDAEVNKWGRREEKAALCVLSLFLHVSV